MTVIHDDNANPINSSNPLPVRQTYDSGDSFNVSINNPNATGGLVVKAATSGSSIYVTDVVISASTGMSVRLEDGAGTVVLQPIYLAANGTFEHSFETPKMVAASQSLKVVSSASGNVTVSVDGYIA